MLLLFDFDGVIADSFDALLDVCVRAQERLGMGRAPTAEDFRTIRNLTFDELARVVGLSGSTRAAYAEAVFEIQTAGWQTPPFPDIVEVLRTLAEEHTLAVVTNSKGSLVATTLEEYGLRTVMAGVVGGDSGLTKPERIGQLRQVHAAGSQDTVMIGDTLGDITAGQQAGVRTVAVTWGFQPGDLLMQASPDSLVDTPRELLALFRSWYERGEGR